VRIGLSESRNSNIKRLKEVRRFGHYQVKVAEATGTGGYMNEQPKSDDTIQRYLLGSASEEECDAFERCYLSDDAEFERVSAAEDDLIEDYLDGRLQPAETHRFEEYFLSAAQRREKLDFARSLRTVLPQPSVSKQRKSASAQHTWFRTLPALDWMRWAPAAGRAVAAVACGLLIFQNRQLSRDVHSLRAEKAVAAELNHNPTLEISRRQDQTPEAREARALKEDEQNFLVASQMAPKQPMVGAVLSPLLTRSGGSWQRITIPPGSQLVELKLSLLDEEYRFYRTTVRLAEGQELLSQSHLRPTSRRQVVTLVPAVLLPPGDYQVLLAGEAADGTYTPAASYTFRILR